MMQLHTLFSAFPAGFPGVGLLLLRLVVASTLGGHGFLCLLHLHLHFWLLGESSRTQRNQEQDDYQDSFHLEARSSKCISDFEGMIALSSAVL